MRRLPLCAFLLSFCFSFSLVCLPASAATTIDSSATYFTSLAGHAFTGSHAYRPQRTGYSYAWNRSLYTVPSSYTATDFYWGPTLSSNVSRSYCLLNAGADSTIPVYPPTGSTNMGYTSVSPYVSLTQTYSGTYSGVFQFFYNSLSSTASSSTRFYYTNPITYTVPASPNPSHFVNICFSDFRYSFGLYLGYSDSTPVDYTNASQYPAISFSSSPIWSTSTVLFSVVIGGTTVYEESLSSGSSFNKTFYAPDNSPVSLVFTPTAPGSLSLGSLSTQYSLGMIRPSIVGQFRGDLPSSYYPDSALGTSTRARIGAIRYSEGFQPPDVENLPGGWPTTPPSSGGDNQAVLDAISDLGLSIDEVKQVLDEHTATLASIAEEQKATSQAIQDQTEEVKKGFAGILDAILNLPQTLLDGVIHLFVPTEEDLQNIKDSYDELLQEKLGLGYQAIELVDSIVTSVASNLASSTPYDFTFPGISFPMNGDTIVILPETSVSLDNAVMDLLRPVAGTAVTIISVLAFINMLKNFLEALLSGKGVSDFDGSG